MLLIFDNGLTSIGRLILLDSHLLAFTAATAYALVCLATDNQGVPQNKLTVKEEGNKESKKNPHEIINDTAIISSVQKLPKHKLKRYKSINTYPEINKLTAGILGVLLGCVISIKWIGCLVMLLAGIFIIYDLYMKLLYCKMTRVIQDFTWYALFLILVPLSIYVGLFYIHFKIVNESGEDDGFMSTRFQFSLKNGSFTKTRKYISFGKQVTIKSNRGYLHSHTHVYGDDDATDDMVNEEGALRQTTIYSAKDSNNNFYFQNVTDNKNVTFLKNLDNVVIYHAETKGYIEPNSKEAYYSKGRRIVNRKGVPMRKSVWIVESANDSMGLESKVKAISTEVYLKNLEYNCYLNTSENKYPGWGYNQGEVFCAVEKEDATMWHVEENFWSEKDGNPLYTSLRSSFISNLIEHNILMFKTNKGFVQNEDLEPERIISKPGDWPILKRGLKMSQWGDKHKFYMFMNPMLLYLSTFGIMALPLYYFYSIIKNIRQLNKQTYRNDIINKQKHRNDKIDKHSSFKIAEMTSNGSEGVTFETANFKRPVNKSREIFIEKDRKRMKNEGIF
ncbi:dolichyl-phosphate-mannose-protein mannosyltransferase, partial [Pancytospora epiphaga]